MEAEKVEILPDVYCATERCRVREEQRGLADVVAGAGSLQALLRVAWVGILIAP